MIFLFSHYHHHWTVLCPKREEGYANFCGSSSHSSSRRRRNIDCTHIAHHGRRRVPTMLLRTKRRDQLPANIAAVGGGCCGCGEGGDGSCGDDHAPTKMLPMNMWHIEWMLSYQHDFIWNPLQDEQNALAAAAATATMMPQIIQRPTKERLSSSPSPPLCSTHFYLF